MAIGIDLGTTYSCVGVWKNGTVEIIANDQGNRTTPSYVAFKDNERMIGDAAKNQASSNPTNTVFDAKRLIGRTFSDRDVQADMKLWPFQVVPGEDDKPMIAVSVNGKSKNFHAEEISSMILMKMKESAEAYLGHEVTKAVITVPAYFNDSQRQATRNAGQICGLEVLRIINEPTAAAIAYGMDTQGSEDEERNILVYDMGGGTFDVSLLTISDGVFEVKATAGDTHLGGEDFDNRLVEFCMQDFKRKNRGRDLSGDHKAIRKLRTQCERAKRTLSSCTTVTIEVDSLFDGIDYSCSLSRARFEEMCMEHFRKSMEPVEKCLKDSGIDRKDVHEVVLVGGSTRIPKVQQMIKDLFYGKELNKSINPDEAVAFGAAVQAAILSKAALQEERRTQLSRKDTFVSYALRPMGLFTQRVSSIKEVNKSISPDEAVEVPDMLLLDVTPLSLGIMVAGRTVEKVVARNTPIPTEQRQTFETAYDYQEGAIFPVYEGEHRMADDNHLLGEFEVENIPRAPKGQVRFSVCFQIDESGIVTVTAREETTGKSNQLTITNHSRGGRLSKDQIDRASFENKQFCIEDAKNKQIIEARNNLEDYCFSIRNKVNEMQHKLKLADKDKIEKSVNEALEWLEDNHSADKDVLESKQRKLGSVLLPIMDKI